jgi:hypothetical protein
MCHYECRLTRYNVFWWVLKLFVIPDICRHMVWLFKGCFVSFVMHCYALPNENSEWDRVLGSLEAPRGLRGQGLTCLRRRAKSASSLGRAPHCSHQCSEARWGKPPPRTEQSVTFDTLSIHWPGDGRLHSFSSPRVKRNRMYACFHWCYLVVAPLTTHLRLFADTPPTQRKPSPAAQTKPIPSLLSSPAPYRPLRRHHGIGAIGPNCREVTSIWFVHRLIFWTSYMCSWTLKPIVLAWYNNHWMSLAWSRSCNVGSVTCNFCSN